MNLPTKFEVLIDEVNRHELYKKLIEQLNKDFLLANIDFSFHFEDTPEELIRSLHETIFKLIQEKFTEYLNLLYIIDVSEQNVKSINETDPLRISKKITFLIVQREWQKVWYKHKY
jgi:hypothetical protein